jgi:hypothetical protein
LKYATNFEMKKFENFHFLNLKWKSLKIFIFAIGNEKVSFLKFEKIGYITIGKWKNWNEEIIFFIYVIEIKLPIIPLYLLCIPPYTTCASCGGIQFISAVESFHTDPFLTVV